MMQDLIQCVEALGSPRVGLLGDFMLDRYVYGDVERISPEAPVPVLNVVRKESCLGGAGNVAAGVLALGGKVGCIGVTGKDAAAEEMSQLLYSVGAETSSLLRLPGRQTAVKVRYVGLAQHRRAQQMVRVDTRRPIRLRRASGRRSGPRWPKRPASPACWSSRITTRAC